jgi:four helix bundle protein
VDNNFENLAIASELAIELRKAIDHFPPEEKFVLVSFIRDEMLSVIENLALGTARYHPIDQYRYLVRASKSLELLHSRFAICRTTGYICKEDMKLIEWKHDVLRTHLTEMITAQAGIVQNLQLFFR